MFFAAATIAMFGSACERQWVGAQRVTGPDVNPPVRELRDFDIKVDEDAARILDALFADPSNSTRELLAKHYAINGYRAMAILFSTAVRVARGQDAGPWMSEAARRETTTRWGCSEPAPAVEAEIRAIEGSMSTSDYVAAVRRGNEAQERFESSCRLQVETAVATLALATTDTFVSTKDVEKAIRAIVTSDVEMQIQAHTAPRAWPYQLMTAVLISRGEFATAVVTADAAWFHLEASRSEGSRVSVAAEEQIRTLQRKAREGLKRAR